MGCYQSKTKEAYSPHTNVILSNKATNFYRKKLADSRFTMFLQNPVSLNKIPRLLA